MKESAIQFLEWIKKNANEIKPVKSEVNWKKSEEFWEVNCHGAVFKSGAENPSWVFKAGVDGIFIVKAPHDIGTDSVILSSDPEDVFKFRMMCINNYYALSGVFNVGFTEINN